MRNIINTKITEVTIFEDRAHIRRAGAIKLKNENSSFVVENVSPILVNKTLNAKLTNSKNSKIVNVYVKRSYKILSEDKPEKIREYEELLADINSDIEKIKNEEKYIDAALVELNSIFENYLNELGEDIAWGLNHAGLDEYLEKLIKNKDGYHKTNLENFRELRKKIKKAKKIRDALANLYSPSVIRRADIIINIISEIAESTEIEIEYVVPGACWRPAYLAQLKEGNSNNELSFECGGSVWQNTGEDWENVDIKFSTERPSLGTEPPRLISDILNIKKKETEIIVEARDQEIQTTGLGEPKKVDMPGIDDGGDVLVFKSSVKANVLSDGRPYKVNVFKFTEKADVRLILIPELSENVILETSLINSTQYPLLAGPVDLIKDYGKIGRTSIMYVSPNEKFKLGFGPDNEVSVKRYVFKKELKKKMLSSYLTKEYTVTVKISNIGNNNKEIYLQERIPISEIEKLKIQYKPEKEADDIIPDENGILNWKISLEPYERKQILFKYLIHKHKDVAAFPV